MGPGDILVIGINTKNFLGKGPYGGRVLLPHVSGQRGLEEVAPCGQGQSMAGSCRDTGKGWEVGMELVKFRQQKAACI